MNTYIQLCLLQYSLELEISILQYSFNLRLAEYNMSQFLNKLITTEHRMAEKNKVPNLEARATDGNPVFTPRQRLERFRQFCIREHKIDIAPLLKGEDVTDKYKSERLNSVVHRILLAQDKHLQ